MKAMIITGALIFGAIVALGSCAQAHEHDGMVYDSWCCNNQDCSVAEDVKFLGDGKLQVTTKHGTALFDLRTIPAFRIKPSTDGRYHACIVKSSLAPQPKGRCIYLPAGI